MSETKHVRVILINGQKIDVEHEGSAESFIQGVALAGAFAYYSTVGKWCVPFHSILYASEL